MYPQLLVSAACSTVSNGESRNDEVLQSQEHADIRVRHERDREGRYRHKVNVTFEHRSELLGEGQAEHVLHAPENREHRGIGVVFYATQDIFSYTSLEVCTYAVEITCVRHYNY